jgi:hypothetical protein
MKLATIGMAMMLLSATAVLADAVLRSVHRRCEAEVSLDPWERAGRGVFLMPRATKVLSALPLLSLAVSRAKEPESCSDPSSESLRTSLHYSDVAPNPAESCSVCGFFSSAADSPQSCGRCMIMSDLVNSHGHCDSWAQKS